MPFTPFHLGPAVLLGALLYRWLDLPALFVGSVVVDGRTAAVFFGYLDPPLHGPLHTFLGGTLLGLAIAVAWTRLRPRFGDVLSALGMARERPFAAVLAGALVAVWLHVLLDALLYLDVQPFAPVTDANPFRFVLAGPRTPGLVYAGCVVAGILGAFLYGYRHFRGNLAPRSSG